MYIDIVAVNEPCRPSIPGCFGKMLDLQSEPKPSRSLEAMVALCYHLGVMGGLFTTRHG